MSFAVVQNVTSNGGGTASVAIDNVQPGNDLLVFVSTSANGTPNLVSVTLDGADITSGALLAWSTGTYPSVGEYFGMGVYLVPNPGAGSHTAAVTVGYSGWVAAIQVAEVSPGLGAVDVASAIATGNSTTGATAQISPTVANDVVLAVLAAYGTPGCSAGSGFTEIGEENVNPDAFWEYQAQGAATPVTPSVGISSTTPWGMASLAVKYAPPATALTVNGGLPSPSTVAVSTATTGGLLPASTTSYYVVTALNALGETLASREVSVTTGAGTSTNTNTVTWSAVSGATSYRVYRTPILAGYTPASGQESVYFPVSGGSTTSFLDTNGTTSIGTPPTVNTTAAAIIEGATGVAVTGANFASGMTAAIVQPGGVSVSQTFTFTDSTDGTFDLTMEPGTGDNLAFTDGVYATYLVLSVGGKTGPGFPIQLAPAAGLIFKTLTSVNPTSAYAITAVPALAAGDQLEAAGNASGTTAAPAGLSLNPDATYQFASGSTAADFYVRAYDGTNKVWGAWALQTVSVAVFASAGNSVSTGTSSITTEILASSSGRSRSGGVSSLTNEIILESVGKAVSTATSNPTVGTNLKASGSSKSSGASSFSTTISLRSSGFSRSRGTSRPSTAIAFASAGRSAAASIADFTTAIAMESRGAAVQLTGSAVFTSIAIRSVGRAVSTGTAAQRSVVHFTSGGRSVSAVRSSLLTAKPLESRGTSTSSAAGRIQFGAAFVSQGRSRNAGISALATGISLVSVGRSTASAVLVQTFPARFGYAIVTPLSQSGVQAAEQAYVEGSTVYVEVAYFDSTGSPFVPNVVTYNVTDVNSGTSLVSSTQVIPAESEIITIKGGQNYMVSLTRASEQHAIVVGVTDGFGNPGYGQATFDVIRPPGT